MVNLKIFALYCPTAKHGKAYDFSLIQSIRRKTLQYLDDIDVTSFGFQEFLNVFDRDNITKISRYTNKACLLIMQLLQRLHQLKIGLID